MDPDLAYNNIYWCIGITVESTGRHPLMVRELGETRGCIFIEKKDGIADQNGSCYRE
jgi:hypothetical protein